MHALMPDILVNTVRNMAEDKIITSFERRQRVHKFFADAIIRYEDGRPVTETFLMETHDGRYIVGILRRGEDGTFTVPVNTGSFHGDIVTVSTKEPKADQEHKVAAYRAVTRAERDRMLELGAKALEEERLAAAGEVTLAPFFAKRTAPTVPAQRLPQAIPEIRPSVAA